MGSWEPTATLPSVCAAARGASAPTEGGDGRGHIVAAARLYSLFVLTYNVFITDAVSCKFHNAYQPACINQSNQITFICFIS